MSDPKISELQRELERAHQQLNKVETSIGDTLSSQELAQNIIKVTVEQMHEGVQIIDREFRYVYLNDAAAKQGNQSRWEILGKSMIECFPQLVDSDFYAILTDVMNTRKATLFENFFVRADGTEAWYELHMEPHPIGVLIRSIDITEKKKLQEEFLHAQKMESIGRLAGGIAHDFNNKLGILTLYCEMAANKLESDPVKVRGYLEKMQSAIQQASVLTRQLLAFSRKQVLDMRVMSLNSLLETSRVALAKLIGENIDLNYKLAPDLGNVRVDASQIDQVLLNLCINARDAIEGTGTITIETKNTELDESYCAKFSDLKSGRYILLSVSDTGSGMTEEIKRRVFEPFFTTKTEGRGTGLGLSMVHGIVKQCSGHIWIYSEPNIGTTFKIYLPRVDAALDSETSETDEMINVSGTETILVVEDDPALREAFENALVNVGYTVLLADNGISAREVFYKNKDKITLLLTDVVLPKASGSQLAKEFAGAKPELKIAYVSGYTENAISQHNILEKQAVLIQKPISIKTFLKAVRQVIDGTLVKGII